MMGRHCAGALATICSAAMNRIGRQNCGSRRPRARSRADEVGKSAPQATQYHAMCTPSPRPAWVRSYVTTSFFDWDAAARGRVGRLR